MERKEVTTYLGAGINLSLGVILILGSLFYGFNSNWELDGFGGMVYVTLGFGLVLLISGVLSIFEAKGKKWAKILNRILLWIIILFIASIIIGGIIITR